jgi:hypothetical protein
MNDISGQNPSQVRFAPDYEQQRSVGPTGDLQSEPLSDYALRRSTDDQGQNSYSSYNPAEHTASPSLSLELPHSVELETSSS